MSAADFIINVHVAFDVTIAIVIVLSANVWAIVFAFLFLIIAPLVVFLHDKKMAVC